MNLNSNKQKKKNKITTIYEQAQYYLIGIKSYGSSVYSHKSNFYRETVDFDDRFYLSLIQK